MSFTSTLRRRTTALALLCLLGACAEESINEPRLIVFLERLPETAENVVYELWAANEEELVSLTRFQTINTTVNLSLPVNKAVSEATALLLTVEPRYFFFDTPSESVLLAGDIIDGSAQLSMRHERALDVDFGSAVGSFRLATPTSEDEDDFDQGLWWYDTLAGEPEQSLYLPPLPAGWMYEGWVVGGERPLSLGKFPDPARFDTDLAGAAADELPAPLYPGQDFIEPPELLSGFSAMITVEPQPDYALAPYGVEILFDQVIESLRINQPMENRTDRGLPAGRATINVGWPRP